MVPECLAAPQMFQAIGISWKPPTYPPPRVLVGTRSRPHCTLIGHLMTGIPRLALHVVTFVAHNARALPTMFQSG
jgi:hypothetical protein